jgi:hypothetical protein
MQVCPWCGASNGVRDHSASEVPYCGRCNRPLEPSTARTGTAIWRRIWPALVLPVVAFFALGLGAIQVGYFSLGNGSVSPNQSAGCEVDLEPTNGVQDIFADRPRTSSLTVHPDAGSDYFLKVMQPGSLSLVATLFIHGGSTVEMPLPTGGYVIKGASGAQWCGETNLFGQDTSVFCLHRRSDPGDRCSTYSFSQEKGWTIDLHSERGGDSEMRRIEWTDF